MLASPLPRRRGVALIIVLAFVVLLTGLVIAFFSRSIVDRQVSNSSANQALSALFSTLESSSAQSASTDPMSIIMTTLSSAGISN